MNSRGTISLGSAINIRRTLPAIFVLCSVTLATIALASMAYGIGRIAGDTETRFFLTWAPPTLDEASAACPVEYALRSTDRNDVVFLGDSTCRTGLDAERFARITGLTSYGLGSLRGIGPTGFVITAKAYLSHHPRPRAIVLCVTPTCFEADPAVVGGPLAGRFAASYGPEVSEFSPLVDRVSYFARHGVRALLWQPRDASKERMNGHDVRDVPLTGLAAETYHTLQRKTLESRGFFPLPGLHGPLRAISAPEETLIRDDWNNGIQRLAAICDEADVPLIIQFAPVSSQITRSRDFGRLEAWSRELETSHSRLIVARPILRTFDERCMWDSIHLNAAGVDKFMPLIAADVEAALAK